MTNDTAAPRSLDPQREFSTQVVHEDARHSALLASDAGPSVISTLIRPETDPVTKLDPIMLPWNNKTQSPTLRISPRWQIQKEQITDENGNEDEFYLVTWTVYGYVGVCQENESLCVDTSQARGWFLAGYDATLKVLDANNGQEFPDGSAIRIRATQPDTDNSVHSNSYTQINATKYSTTVACSASDGPSTSMTWEDDHQTWDQEGFTIQDFGWSKTEDETAPSIKWRYDQKSPWDWDANEWATTSKPWVNDSGCANLSDIARSGMNWAATAVIAFPTSMAVNGSLNVTFFHDMEINYGASCHSSYPPSNGHHGVLSTIQPWWPWTNIDIAAAFQAAADAKQHIGS